MKFEYDDVTDRGECVAFVDSLGCLVVKIDGDKNLVIGGRGVPFVGGESWSFMWENCGKYSERKFYPGDKITITF